MYKNLTGQGVGLNQELVVIAAVTTPLGTTTTTSTITITWNIIETHCAAFSCVRGHNFWSPRTTELGEPTFWYPYWMMSITDTRRASDNRYKTAYFKMLFYFWFVASVIFNDTYFVIFVILITTEGRGTYL